MKLDVVDSAPAWYADGLKFTCTQCGNCCTGGPGFVWISEEEIGRLAELLELSREQTIERYCHQIGDRTSLRESQNAQGLYDCIFLKEGSGGKRICGVYTARPLQCRTWPFWAGNLASREAWDAAAVRCHGMNHGRQFSALEIATIAEMRPSS